MDREVIDLQYINFHEFVESLIKTIELKDIYTAGHSKRVSEIAELICRRMNMSDEECHYMHIAGHLHDIGKIGIADGILLKTGRLSEAEYMIMQQHPSIGAQIFENLEGFEKMSAIIKHHHERFDGRGYPDMLKGDEIPIGAALISIADSFDAMTTPRSYRSEMSADDAMDEIVKNSGGQFHPDLVNIFRDIYCIEKDSISCIIAGRRSCPEQRAYVPFNSTKSRADLFSAE